MEQCPVFYGRPFQFLSGERCRPALLLYICRRGSRCIRKRPRISRFFSQEACRIRDRSFLHRAFCRAADFAGVFFPAELDPYSRGRSPGGSGPASEGGKGVIRGSFAADFAPGPPSSQGVCDDCLLLVQKSLLSCPYLPFPFFLLPDLFPAPYLFFSLSSCLCISSSRRTVRIRACSCLKRPSAMKPVLRQDGR